MLRDETTAIGRKVSCATLRMLVEREHMQLSKAGRWGRGSEALWAWGLEGILLTKSIACLDASRVGWDCVELVGGSETSSG